jgi:zinc protease
MKRSRIWHLSCLSLLGLAACASKGPQNSAPSTQFDKKEVLEPMAGFKIHRLTHPSGLEVFLIPKEGTGVVAMATAYNVGSRFESKGRTGLAHLFEHMMFRGTESFPEPFKTLSSWGGRFNAYTSLDVTLYHQEVPKELLSQATQFEAERMRKLMITRNGFNTERGAVVSERKMRSEDAPFGRLNWELYQLAFDKHPYKTPPIGYQEDLDATTLEEALDFYKRFYAPNRAKITWVGDFSISEAMKILEKHYGSFTAQAWTEPKIPIEPRRSQLRRKVLPMKVESVYMADAVTGPRYNEAEAAIDTMLCTLLANSKLGFLSFELVEKKIARIVSASCSPSVDPELSAIYLVGNPGVSVKKLESAYLAARKNFLAWLNPNRIEQLKLYYLSGQWDGLRSPANLAEQISQNAAVVGDPLFTFKFIQDLQKVTQEDIVRRYKTWNVNPTRVILEPSQSTPPLRKGKRA